jgi:hypothetical protein
MHILDSWYHLNRTDQIIGRAIRYCSHAALRAVEERQSLPPMALNNCLIYMHVTQMEATESGPAFETADMYAYRIAIGKAQMVGRVQRLLKKHAWDCNLELEAITFAGLPPRVQQDAQGNDRRSLNEDGSEMDGYSINDQDYTTYCDYQVCRHECAVAIATEGLHLDTSTFSVADARRLVLAKQSAVRKLFEDQVMIPETVVQEIFSDLPWEIASEALMELIDGRRFKLTRPDGVAGFLVKKAGFLVFQPAGVDDTDIPMSLRYARGFQLRRHLMEPRMPVWGRGEAAGTAAPAAAKASPGLVAEAEAGEGEATTGTAAAAGAAPVASPILAKWAEWLAYVNTGGKSAFPSSLTSTQRIWSWILERYAPVPELRQVALRWWIDKIASYADQRILLELAAGGAVDELTGGLVEALGPDIFRSGKLVAYRIFNPETNSIDFFSRSTEGGPFTPCSSSIAAIVDKSLGNTPVNIATEAGTLLGFIAPKDKRIVFKTLDTTKEKKHSSVGAECGNTSNLGEHHPRIRMLHAAGRASDMAPLMLEDADETWDKAGAKVRMAAINPEHMKDITHQPLCLYMEFLTRILDARHIGDRRWFLGAIQTVQAKMKAKK